MKSLTALFALGGIAGLLLVNIPASVGSADLWVDSKNSLSQLHEINFGAQDDPRPGERSAVSPPETRLFSSILPADNDSEIAGALNIPLADVIDINMVSTDVRALGRGQSTLGYSFPIAGPEFLIMSTGLATSAELANNASNLSTVLDGLNNQQGNDMAQLWLDLSVPPGVNCASFDFAFFSEEFPEYVGSTFNDAFTAEFGGSDLSIVGSSIQAPLNFAFDAEGNLITINTVSGVTDPTNSTYDGKTPLRRAQVGVTSNEDITIVLSIQDLGDSIYDSAVFLDNFFWSNNADCGGFVEPPPQAMSTLQLHMAASLPVDAHIRPKATIKNLSAAPTAYTVEFELWQGFGVLENDSFPIVIQPDQSQQLSTDFGQRPAGTYTVWAYLFQGTEMLEMEYQYVVIGEEYLSLKKGMDELTTVAHQELTDGQKIAVAVLADAVYEAGKEVVVSILEMIVGVFAEMKGVSDIPSEVIEETSGNVADWMIDLGDAIEHKVDGKVEPFWTQNLDERGFKARHGAVDNAANTLLQNAYDESFTWQSVWAEDVARYKEEISSRNEAARIGYGLEINGQAPFIHRASLTELQGQFNWFKDSFLPAVDKILFVVLVILAVIALIAFVILTFGSGTTIAAPAAALMSSGLPTAFAYFKAAGVTKLFLGTIVLLLMGALVGATAVTKTSVTVVDEHAEAMDDFAGRVGAGAAGRVQREDLSTRLTVNGYDINAAINDNDRGSDATPVYAQLFRGDGQLLAFDRLEEDGKQLSANWHVPPGSYWAIIMSRDTRQRSVYRSDVEVTSPQVALSVQISDPHLQIGDGFEAQVVLTNMDQTQGTGPLVGSIRVLPGEKMEMFNVELGPGQQQAIPFTFVPQDIGSYVVQAQVSDEEVLLHADEAAFVVGSGPAFSLSVDAGLAYHPGNTVQWEAVVKNAGTQSGSTTLSVETYNLSGYNLSNAWSQSISLAAGTQQTSLLQILPDATPGLYIAHVMLGDDLRYAVEFIVTADGALFATVSSTPQYADIGQSVGVRVNVQNEVYSPVDATVQAVVTTPAGNSVPLSLQQLSQGVYEGVYTPGTPGTYVVVVEASRLNYHGTKAETYIVADEVSLLEGDSSEQLVLDIAKPVEVIVKNEVGVPVPGATIIISSTTGIQADTTGSDGVADFYIKAVDDMPVDVLIQKSGYASTSMSLPVAVEPDSIAPSFVWYPPEITNLSTLSFPGKTEPGATVVVQGQPTSVDGEGKFTATVQLQEGSNTIGGTATDAAENQAALSSMIWLDTIPPQLAVYWPSGVPEDWGDTVLIEGQTEADSLVIVNGIQLSSDETGYFSTWIEAQGSAFVIVVQVIDRAGNMSQAQRSYGLISGVFLPITLAIPEVTTPSQPLLNNGFEQGPGVGWVEYSSNGWPIVTHVNGLPNTLPAPSGQWAAWLGGDHYEISYIEQAVTVPTDRPYLTYSHFLASEDYCGYDFAGTLVNSTVVDVYDLCQDTNSTVWSRRSVDLSAYRGQTVALQIRVETDGSLFSSLYVDDVGFSASPAAAQTQSAAPQSTPGELTGRAGPAPQAPPGPAEPRRLR